MISDSPSPAAAEEGRDEAPAAASPKPDATPPAQAEPDEDSLRLAEALVFASATPVSARALGQLLPDTADADAVIAALRARYAGRGVELVETAGGVQFRTAPEFAPRLRKVIEMPRRLPRVAMETLAIIAYHQPCTRAEIEEIRGTSLSQQTLDALLEANLVAPKGRREVPGRPTLWGTTPQFLVQFGLRDIRDLPQRTDLLLEPPTPSGVSDAPPMTPELPAADFPPGESAEPATGENPAPNRDDAPPSQE
jgi:segregation and condensation protein B